MKKCSRCGSISSDDEYVCGVCGSSLEGTVPTNIEQATQVQEQPLRSRTQANKIGPTDSLVEFFRHCPGCGRRFHIVLVEKKEVEEHEEIQGPAPLRPVHAGVGQRLEALVPVEASMELREATPNVFSMKEFQYRYKCKHCGHEWTEIRLKEQNIGRVDSPMVVDEKEEYD